MKQNLKFSTESEMKYFTQVKARRVNISEMAGVYLPIFVILALQSCSCYLFSTFTTYKSTKVKSYFPSHVKTRASFPVIHKVGNIGIFVQLLMEIN